MKTQEHPYDLHPEAQILQSTAWGDVHTALGHKIHVQSGAGWHWQAIEHRRRYGTYLEVPLGPTIANQSGFEGAISSLIALGKQLDAVFVRIEPVGDITEQSLIDVGAQRAEKNFQPQHTLVLDLTEPLADIKTGLNKGRKSALNRAVSQQVTFEHCKQASAIEDFLEMIHITYQRTGIQAHSDSYYRTIANTMIPQGTAQLFYAVHNNKRVAGVLAFDSPTTRYYIHAASLPEARELEAATFLVWGIIVEAKERALKQFDFFGIAPPDQPDHPWAGFTHFKKSFGGEMVTRLGTWEIPLKPVQYKALRTAKRIKKIL